VYGYAAGKLTPIALDDRLATLRRDTPAPVFDAQMNLLGSHDAPRIRTVLGGETARVALAVLLQATLPGAPCLYYGDEVGLAGGNDPECRGSFPWDHPERWDHGLLATFTVAAALRHAHRVLRHGGTRIVATVASTIAYLRFDGHDVALVVVNAGDQPCELSVELPELEERTFVGAAWRGPTGGGSAPMPGAVRVVDGRLELLVPPRDGAVLIAE